MAKQTKSQRIRTLLAQGKTVKEIVKTVKCNPALVYQVKSYDKTKAKKIAAKKPTVKDAQKKLQQAAGVNSIYIKPVYDELSQRHWGDGELYNITRGHRVATQPVDYPTPKRNIVQRFFNWLCGG